MNTHVVNSKPGRRYRGAAVLGLLMTLAGVASAVPAAAETADAATGDATDFTRIDGPRDCAQGPEGSWLYKVTGLDSTGFEFTFDGTETYAAGGGYTEADQLGFTPGYLAQPGHGGWKVIGERKFLLTYLNLTYNADGSASGHGKVRQTTKISADGKSYSGSGDYFYYDTTGALIDHGTFTITAKRIEVEAPK